MAVSDAQFLALARRVQSLEGRPVYVPSGLPSGGGGGGVTDHGALSGLADNDHPQYALLASPVFTGNPTAPTPATSDNDTSIATTAMVQAAVASGGGSAIGTELAYATFVTNITVSGSEAAPTDIVTAGQITYDGTPVMIEFFCAAMETGTTAGDQVIADLYDVNTNLGRIAVVKTPAAASTRASSFTQRKLTPSAGDHTYRIRAWKAGTGNGLMNADAGLNFAPGFIRITRA